MKPPTAFLASLARLSKSVDTAETVFFSGHKTHFLENVPSAGLHSREQKQKSMLSKLVGLLFLVTHSFLLNRSLL